LFVFQLFFLPGTHTGAKPSVSSNPTWLLLKDLPYYKTGVQCQQWPHVQLLATIWP
jgi:hypothetical protein